MLSASLQGPCRGYPTRAHACPVARAWVVVYVLLWGLFFDEPALAGSQPAPVAKTGQTLCFGERSSGTVECAGTGQDGDTVSGIAWPEPRFIDNGDRTVTDRLTGLTWAGNAGRDKEARTWGQALDDVKALNVQGYLGRGDWRLPNVNELESLVNKGGDLVAWLESQGFSNVRADYYWTSSTYAGYPVNAWAVNMYGGMVSGRRKTDIGYVWPVRGGGGGAASPARTGQTACHNAAGTPVPCAGTGQDGELQKGVVWPVPRFTARNDQTRTDRLTGLIWSGHAKASGPAACSPGEWKTHREALDYVHCLNTQEFQGKTDWRLPNRNELQSLVNRGQPNSAVYLRSHGFVHVQGYGYWSSTSYAHATWNAWIVNLHDGAAVPVAKKIHAHVLPVRSEREAAAVEGESSL